ncbi:Aerobic cobaltochelatase subunit CobN [Defluviimonas aquaemixtae]|uniref:Aerobic cobaltochelatase subunit CobN n=1 Tax=Albidovulum aquaemixtae TaxID=1542388 RepID=A0A2R8BKA3_9RHOB|nr:cobaltochelatase subunit CobN [Defluviimonas aquaemixtae]SPH23778.1 Aerobic cobaltochelatase subunit CobN [Defluviimonas aquaemixtae]
MHVIFRESHGLEETDTPRDLGQDPADLVALSFSDSDLGAFAAGWHRAAGALPTLRLANLVALRHPLSVDTYVEQTLAGAKGILIRLIGGESYWPYGLAQVQDLARRRGIALAVLPADGRDDARLDELSTLPKSTLRRLQSLCDAGGTVAAQAALQQMALAVGLYAGPVAGDKTVPPFGWYLPGKGVAPVPEVGQRPLAVVTFYRSYLTSADTDPVDALITALEKRGFAAVGAYAASLKDPAAATWLRAELARLKPAAIVNATAFSAKGADGGASPLDAPGCPVFQVALSTARKKDWTEAERGLSPADLAMHVVLPEVDGRIFAGVASFKQPSKMDADLQYSRFVHRADPDRTAAVADRVAGWHRLSTTPAGGRNLALVLSTYPGKAHQLAHAVGLDALDSAEAILGAMAGNGHAVMAGDDLGAALSTETLEWPVSAYLDTIFLISGPLREALFAAWGEPDTDPAVVDGHFRFQAIRRGQAIVALQPERGDVKTRGDDYHDLSRTPRHAYVAFYLWLRSQRIHALIHIGAHGTLEWMPGKSVALSKDCWPEALTGDLPVIYPFIVNDPGEAAQAKRRIGAVTIGHLPPPLAESAVPEDLNRLERLLDEYSTADGLDPARRDRLIAAIREEARGRGVEDDLGVPEDASPAEAITRIDRFVCDIKESQYGEGLHVFGNGRCGAEERAGLLAALNGRRVDPGPSGSPFRGRSDVLPTGRNLYTTDPRAVPSRAAHAQGVKLAEELLRRHLQDKGDWPKSLVVDLWGSATMRTAGEEFAMALHLAGLSPKWDEGSERVSGFEVIPLALLRRPRIDVTLRVSGLFRDVFPGLAQLFEAAAAALSEREEAPGDNPYLHATPRVFGPKPGLYGLAMGEPIEDYGPDGRLAAGEAWLSGSEWAIDASGDAHPARAALEAQVKGADGFVHVQDLLETDLLLASDYAAHEGGFAAAVARLGGHAPALYHVDATRPNAPRARTLTEEIGRVVRARAANPRWADGMMNHGFRGAAEIAATLDHMAAFAHLARAVPAHLFDLYHEATLGRDDIVAFMERENPGALSAMRDRFSSLAEAGLWVTRRNSIAMEAEG